MLGLQEHEWEPESDHSDRPMAQVLIFCDEIEELFSENGNQACEEREEEREDGLTSVQIHSTEPYFTGSESL